MRVVRQKYGSSTPSHLLHPLYTPTPTPCTLKGLMRVARRKIREFLGQCGRAGLFLCKI